MLTLLTAPWLLRQGQHIRVDILLRALPARLGWLLEWLGDLLGLACSLYFVWYGWKVLAASYTAGAISIKTLVTPEWWLLVPLPVAFLLFAIEFVFRMHRLAQVSVRRVRCGIGIMMVENSPRDRSWRVPPPPSPSPHHAGGVSSTRGQGSGPCRQSA